MVVGDELTVLLTRRTDHLTDHPGQISFPGGRAEPEDVDAVETALREAQEEIGLVPSAGRGARRLPTYTTVTGFHRHAGGRRCVRAGFTLRSIRSRWPRPSRCRCRS